MVTIISLNINDVFDDVTADTALSQKYTGFSYRKTIGYSSPRAVAVLWQGNSNYYAC
jgi:hypothetical protein